MTDDDDLLIEQVASAHRPTGKDELRYHPAWYDLSAEGREGVRARACASRGGSCGGSRRAVRDGARRAREDPRLTAASL